MNLGFFQRSWNIWNPRWQKPMLNSQACGCYPIMWPSHHVSFENVWSLPMVMAHHERERPRRVLVMGGWSPGPLDVLRARMDRVEFLEPTIPMPPSGCHWEAIALKKWLRHNIPWMYCIMDIHTHYHVIMYVHMFHIDIYIYIYWVYGTNSWIANSSTSKKQWLTEETLGSADRSFNWGRWCINPFCLLLLVAACWIYMDLLYWTWSFRINQDQLSIMNSGRSCQVSGYLLAASHGGFWWMASWSRGHDVMAGSAGAQRVGCLFHFFQKDGRTVVRNQLGFWTSFSSAENPNVEPTLCRATTWKGSAAGDSHLVAAVGGWPGSLDFSEENTWDHVVAHGPVICDICDISILLVGWLVGIVSWDLEILRCGSPSKTVYGQSAGRSMTFDQMSGCLVLVPVPLQLHCCLDDLSGHEHFCSWKSTAVWFASCGFMRFIDLGDFRWFWRSHGVVA